MDSKKICGMAIAVSAATLFVAGCASSGGAGGTATEARITCNGANACKGLSECHTAKNECAGQNACKGQGWVRLTAADCKKATGGG